MSLTLLDDFSNGVKKAPRKAPTMPLSDKLIKSAKPSARHYKLFDAHGLYLLVSPTGVKSWKLKYRHKGREKKLSLGRYPQTSLAEARKRLIECRGSLAGGIDPARPRRNGSDDFEAVAREWLEKRRVSWKSEKTHRDATRQLSQLIFPEIGNHSISEIEAPEILEALRKIEARGTHELAHRVHHYISQIFRYAIATRRAKRDPAADLRGALTPVASKSLAHLKANELPEFVKKLAAYEGHMTVRLAGTFLLHTFVRTNEMRFARWSEIDWEAKLWRIPKERMKMRRPHLVPLSRQVIAILKEMKRLNGDYDFVFANPTTPAKPISENAVLYAIYRMGYAGRTTGHGFRSTASTILNENGFPPDAIERQLAHVEGNSVRAAYNHAEYLPERKKMMQWWSNYLARLSATR